MRVPQGAAIAFAGRFDLHQLAKALAALTPERDRAEWPGLRQIARGLLLGHDPVNDVAPRIGSNWAGYLIQREAAGNAAFPVDALIAAELSPDDVGSAENNGATLVAALDNALSTGLNYLAAMHNGTSPAAAATVKTSDNNGTLTRWLENFHDYELAYALAPDALIFASSPRLIGQFTSSGNGNNLADSQLFQRTFKKHLRQENQLLFINLAVVRNIVRDNRSFFLHSGGSSAASPPTGADAEKRLARVEDVLRIFDAAFAAGHIDESRIRLVAGAAIDAEREPAEKR
jgi:hypothetical protein